MSAHAAALRRSDRVVDPGGRAGLGLVGQPRHCLRANVVRVIGKHTFLSRTLRRTGAPHEAQRTVKPASNPTNCLWRSQAGFRVAIAVAVFCVRSVFAASGMAR
jgi:hypothetical protein